MEFIDYINIKTGGMVMELFTLILRIILMILEGMLADVAVTKVARESGIPFEKLWNMLPRKYK